MGQSSEGVSVERDKKGNEVSVNNQSINRDKHGNEFVGDDKVFRGPDGKITHLGNRSVYESSGKK